MLRLGLALRFLTGRFAPSPGTSTPTRTLTGTYAEAVLADGPSALWPLDQRAGSTVAGASAAGLPSRANPSSPKVWVEMAGGGTLLRTNGRAGLGAGTTCGPTGRPTPSAASTRRPATDTATARCQPNAELADLALGHTERGE